MGEASTAEWDKSWQNESKEEIKEPTWYGSTYSAKAMISQVPVNSLSQS
jgi:hypothetical protein